MKSHYGMAKQVLRYLQGTYNRFLKFVQGSQLKLVGYCAPEAQGNSHLNTARSWRDDEIRFWVPSRHCSISADITGQQQGDQWT